MKTIGQVNRHQSDDWDSYSDAPLAALVGATMIDMMAISPRVRRVYSQGASQSGVHENRRDHS
jgi:hypothetical protein